jgi:hypothetical protein
MFHFTIKIVKGRILYLRPFIGSEIKIANLLINVANKKDDKKQHTYKKQNLRKHVTYCN